MTQSELEVLEKAINKKWGAGTLVRGTDPALEITRIPTGILSLDVVLGGGIPRGRHTEIYGGYSTGKTYATYRTIASAQELGLRCCFIDVEGSYDPVFAAHAGIDIEDLYMPRRGQHGNRIVDFMEVLIRSRQFDLIVLDSIAALLPKAEQDADMEKGSYGTQQAKLMSAALRRLTTANENTALMYINQTRDNIGSMFVKSTTSGGRAMSFYAGTRLEFTRIENIKSKAARIDPKTGEVVQSNQVIGHRVLVKVDKDKTGGARQHDQTTFVFDYRIGGVDPVEDLIYLGRVYGLVAKKKSSWWIQGYDDHKQNGRPRFKRWLRENEEVAEDLEAMIWEAYEEGPDVDDEEDEEDED
jgi:recombination protein RecA